MVSRVRWKAFAALLVVVGVVMAYLLIRMGMARERTEFVGNVDPTSGYRCRFTISSDGKRNTPEGRRQAAPVNQIEVFNPVRSPARRWMEDHLLHRQAANAPMIVLFAVPMVPNHLRGSFHIVEGYPELTLPGKSRLVTHRHLHIGGGLATVCTLEGAMPSAPIRTSFLLVYLPDCFLLYAVIGSSETLDFAPTDREMQAIISSFHIEKVIPTGGKR